MSAVHDRIKSGDSTMFKRSAVMTVILFGAAVAGVAQSVDFDGDAIGAPPKGWTLTMTGRGRTQMDGRAG